MRFDAKIRLWHRAFMRQLHSTLCRCLRSLYRRRDCDRSVIELLSGNQPGRVFQIIRSRSFARYFAAAATTAQSTRLISDTRNSTAERNGIGDLGAQFRHARRGFR